MREREIMSAKSHHVALRKREVIRRVGYCGVHIDRLEKAGKFPKRIHLGPHAVAWIESEIDQWLQKRIAERDAEEAEAVALKAAERYDAEAAEAKAEKGAEDDAAEHPEEVSV